MGRARTQKGAMRWGTRDKGSGRDNRQDNRTKFGMGEGEVTLLSTRSTTRGP